MENRLKNMTVKNKRKFIKKEIVAFVLGIILALAAPVLQAEGAQEIRIVAQESTSEDPGLAGLYLEEGGAQDLKFLGAPSGWKNLNPQWKTSDPQVAVVDKNGVVTGVAEGTATITFSLSNQMTGELRVTVGTPISLGTAEFKSMALLVLANGEDIDINFYGMPGWDKNICECVWSVNGDAVTVDGRGVVTAVKEGSAELNLTIRNTVSDVLYHVLPTEIMVIDESVLEEMRQKKEVSSIVPTEAEVYEAVISLQEEYPEGMPWTNANYYAWNGGIFSGGYGCAGFAFLLSDAAFGDLPARWHEDVSAIRAGDILRINYDTHSVVVLEVIPEGVIIAEGNFNHSVHWGRFINQVELEYTVDYIITRYPEE